MTRDDFRPRTKPGYYRTNGFVFVRVDKVFPATNYGKLTPRDWAIRGVEPSCSASLLDHRLGPHPDAQLVPFEMPLLTYKKRRWYRIPHHLVPKGWRKFFDTTP